MRGDEDPVQAAADALHDFPADEVIVSTLPPGVSRWIERDVVGALRERVRVPVAHVTAAAGGSGARSGGPGGLSAPARIGVMDDAEQKAGGRGDQRRAGSEAPKPFRNPFRSEEDAFRLLVIIGVSIAAIVIAAKLGGAWAGVPVTLILLALATRATFKWLKVAVSERDPEPGAGPGSV